MTKIVAVVPAVVLMLSAGVAVAAPDAQFITKAIEGDNAEIRLGQLAQERGVSQEVRSFGHTLVQDHSRAREQALQVAQRLGVRPTEAIAPEAQAAEERLRGLAGPDFDREFARVMVENHRKDVDEFRQQSRTGQQETRRLAEQTLPVLERHLEKARALEASR